MVLRTKSTIAADLAVAEGRVKVLKYELETHGNRDTEVGKVVWRYMPSWLAYGLIAVDPDGNEWLLNLPIKEV